MKFTFKIIIASVILFVFCSCDGDDGSARKPVYVKPSVDSRGRIRKGYVRMPVSTKKDAVKKQNKSKYYYKTRGKYRRKSKR